MFSSHSAPRLPVAGHVLKRGLGRRSKYACGVAGRIVFGMEFNRSREINWKWPTVIAGCSQKTAVWPGSPILTWRRFCCRQIVCSLQGSGATQSGLIENSERAAIDFDQAAAPEFRHDLADMDGR